MNENYKMCTLLLDPLTYNPDTLDLNKDDEAREYWFECLAKLFKKFSIQAARSDRNDKTADARAQKYVKTKHISHRFDSINELFFTDIITIAWKFFMPLKKMRKEKNH